MPPKTTSPEIAAAINEAVAAALAQRDEQEAKRLSEERVQRKRSTRQRQVETIEVDGYAHCPDSLRCPSAAKQVPVRLYRETVSESFGERAGEFNSPNDYGTENSVSYLRVVNQDDALCPDCGRVRDLSEQVRPVYEGLSGHSPAKLLELRRIQAGLAPDPATAKRIADLEAEVAAVRGKAA